MDLSKYRFNLPRIQLGFSKFSWPKLPKINLTKIKKVKEPKPIPLIVPVTNKPKGRIFRNSFVMFFLGIMFTVVFILIPLKVYEWFKELPSPSLLVVADYQRNTRILDRKGRLLYEIYNDKNTLPVTLDKIPKDFVEATIAVEDSDFYNHNGVSLRGIARSVKAIFIDKSVQGGSTITQQLIKNVLLSPERTISRKVKEIVLAFLVESKYSKNQILEMYFNNTPYGGNAWGVEAASKKYFGKDVVDLDLAESSLLAGLPSSPTTYSPLTDLALAKERQQHVLGRMVSLGYITQDQSDTAFNEKLNFAVQNDYIRAPHFVDYVKSQLEEKYGKRFVDFGGLTVTTTLDLDLQDKVQDYVTNEVAKSSYLNISNGAAIVLDVPNDQILAYVGSVDYFKPSWGAYDVVTAFRQPGSSIKPVTYALAFAAGYTPGSIISDEPVMYQSPGQAPYIPVNYDGAFHGKVTLRSALANSFNIPAVKLAAALGPDNIVSLGREMGLTNWIVDGTYGLSVTLGGKEVRLLDLANVYSTLARKGMRKEVTPFLSIKDSKGYEIYDSTNPNPNGQQVLSEEVSYLIWSILSDNIARLQEFGIHNFLTVPGYTVAAKTGTTDDKRDNWTFGYTPNYVVGVWVGNNNNMAMNPYLASGLSGAAPIWNDIMTQVLQNQPDIKPLMPKNVFVKSFPNCDNKSELFIAGSNVPSSICNSDSSKDKDKKHK